MKYSLRSLGAFTAAMVVAVACYRAAPGLTPTMRSAVPTGWRYPLDSGVAVGAHGMVATDDSLATEVGVQILRDGGNAIDAAVATAFALAVTHPSAGNIGGGGFIVLRMRDGRTAALDFREAAPGLASRDMYLDSLGKTTNRSLLGHLAAGVPGSVAGLFEAHQRYGSRPWSALVAPAIRLADAGFVLDSSLARGMQRADTLFQKYAGSAALFMPDGQPLRAGSTWRNPDLARTLRRIAEHGPAGFYEGETANLIVAEMARGGGFISKEDLKAYRAKWRDPIRFTYRSHEVISMPLPSSGGMTIVLIAGILREYDLRALGWHSAAELHLLTEAERRAFAVRNHFFGDPDFVSIPTERILSKRFADSLRSSISIDRASPSTSISFGDEIRAEGVHTTHFSVADAQGNAVALTTTLNTGYGSKVVVSGAGFLLNNEMDDFAAKPGAPNGYGLVQGEANAIKPGKRMLSAMAPTIVLDRSGKPMLITGASGGPTIISAVFQIVSNTLDYGMDVSAAVSAPRIHHQHLPDSLRYDLGGFSPALLDSLRARGHALKGTRPGDIGNGASILRGPSGWRGMAEPRANGWAAGY